MNCPNCQAEVAPEAAFCQQCGARMGEPEEGSEQEARGEEPLAQQAEKSAPAPPEPPPAQPAGAKAQAPAYDESTRPLGIGTFFLMLFVFAIPVVNIIMMIVWTLSSKNLNQKNFAAAALIWTVILLVVAVLFSAMVGVFFSVIMEQVFFPPGVLN